MTGLAGIGASIALRASPVGAFLKSVPRWVWIALAAVALILGGMWWHSGKVKRFGEERYAAGVAYEQARLTAKAKALKAKVDALSTKISAQLKERNDEENRAIHRAADTLRLRGPGKAACSGYPSLSASPGRSVAAGGGTDAARAGLPVEDRIAVPFGWVVDSAERCDLNRAEVLAWREWHRQQTDAWAKIGADR